MRLPPPGHAVQTRVLTHAGGEARQTTNNRLLNMIGTFGGDEATGGQVAEAAQHTAARLQLLPQHQRLRRLRLPPQHRRLALQRLFLKFERRVMRIQYFDSECRDTSGCAAFASRRSTAGSASSACAI